MEQPVKLYLGDGAFCEFTGYNYRIFTSNGITESNEIFLEDDHIEYLFKFVSRIRETLREDKPNENE